MSRGKRAAISICCVLLAGLAVAFALLFRQEKPVVSTQVKTTKVMDIATRAELDEAYGIYQSLPAEQEFGFYDDSQQEWIDRGDQYDRVVLTQDFGGLFQVRLHAYFLDHGYQTCILCYLDWSAPDAVPVQVNLGSVRWVKLGEESDDCDNHLLFARYGLHIDRDGLSNKNAAYIRNLKLGEKPFFDETELGFGGFGGVQLVLAPQPYEG